MVHQNLLKNHPVLRSGSLHAIREQLARDYCSHKLYLLGPAPAPRVEFRRAYIKHISFNFLHYGAHVGIEPGAFNTFYMVELPLSGCASISYGGDRVESQQHLGSVLSPIHPVHSSWSADCTRLMVQIPRDRLENYLAALLGVNLRGPLQFQVPLDTSSGSGAMLRRTLIDLVCRIDDDADFNRIPFLPSQYERVVMSALLGLQPHNYSKALAVAGEEQPCHPGFVKRAQTYIDDHFDEDISIEQIAAAARVSPRSLFSGFKRYVGASPLSVLKKRRLDAAHQDLVDGHNAEESVKDIAYRWGFTHLGRFAQLYRQRYGESPSFTLRRSQ